MQEKAIAKLQAKVAAERRPAKAAKRGKAAAPAADEAHYVDWVEPEHLLHLT